MINNKNFTHTNTNCHRTNPCQCLVTFCGAGFCLIERRCDSLRSRLNLDNSKCRVTLTSPKLPNCIMLPLMQTCCCFIFRDFIEWNIGVTLLNCVFHNVIIWTEQLTHFLSLGGLNTLTSSCVVGFPKVNSLTMFEMPHVTIVTTQNQKNRFSLSLGVATAESGVHLAGLCGSTCLFLSPPL